MNIIRAISAIIGRSPIMARHRCNICDHRVWKFLPYRGGFKSAPPLMLAIEFTGSDLDNCECPWCGATDRERHLAMYMKVRGLLDSLAGKEVLHLPRSRELRGLWPSRGPLAMFRQIYTRRDLT
jgi:hypothetical protein